MRLNLKEIEVLERSLDFTVYQMGKEPYASYEFKLRIIEPIEKMRTKIRAERKLKTQALKNKGVKK